MAFEFVLEEAYEIHRDPGGHYHHWTIFAGYVKKGIIKRGDLILIPDRDYIGTPGRVLFFDAFKDVPDEISSETEEDVRIGVGLPAPPEQKLVLPGIAVDCSEELRQSLILSFLEKNPERLFHSQGPSHPHLECRDCMMAIPRVPEAIQLLEKLAKDGEAWISQRAAAVLEHHPSPFISKPQSDQLVRAFWRAFWRWFFWGKR